jgi:hypothetical protein
MDDASRESVAGWLAGWMASSHTEQHHSVKERKNGKN